MDATNIRQELFGPDPTYTFIWDWVEDLTDRWPAFLFEIDVWLKLDAVPEEVFQLEGGLAALESLATMEAAAGGKLPPVVAGVMVAIQVLVDDQPLPDGAVAFDLPEKFVPVGVIRHGSEAIN